MRVPTCDVHLTCIDLGTISGRTSPPNPPPAIPFLVSPSSFEGEAGGVASIAPQGAEWPGDQLGSWVVNVPQVNVLVGNLHHALPIDVQVGTGKEEHVETL